jgi:hypothetical protein
MRRGSQADLNASSNNFAQGEFALETDTRLMKINTGSAATTYNNINYLPTPFGGHGQWTSGRYYYPSMSGSTGGTSNIAASSISFQPVVIPNRTNITAICENNASTGNTFSAIKVALYDSISTGEPNSLIGTCDSYSVGISSISGDGSTVLVTTSSPHNLTSSSVVKISGAGSFSTALTTVATYGPVRTPVSIQSSTAFQYSGGATGTLNNTGTVTFLGNGGLNSGFQEIPIYNTSGGTLTVNGGLYWIAIFNCNNGAIAFGYSTTPQHYGQYALTPGGGVMITSLQQSNWGLTMPTTTTTASAISTGTTSVPVTSTTNVSVGTPYSFSGNSGLIAGVGSGTITLDTTTTSTATSGATITLTPSFPTTQFPTTPVLPYNLSGIAAPRVLVKT